MEEIKYCPECCCKTMHGTSFLFPDEDDSPLVWVCSICLEDHELVD